MAGIVARVRKVFGADARSVDALEQARRDGGQTAVAELAAALAWYARRDDAFARELTGWAAQAGAGGVTQQVHAGRDAYTAGRDQTVVNYRVPASKPGGARCPATRLIRDPGCGRTPRPPGTRTPLRAT